MTITELRHVYDVEVDLNAGLLVPSVGKVCDRINATMHSFGFAEDISLRGPAIVGELTTGLRLDRAMTIATEDIISKAMRNAFQDPHARAKLIYRGQEPRDIANGDTQQAG